MTKKQLLVSAVALAMAAYVPSAVFAQTQKQTQQSKAPAAATAASAPAAAPGTTAAAPGVQDANNAPPPNDQSQGAPDAGVMRRAPVFAVTGVEVFQSSLQPPIDVIRVTGLAPSSSWSEPELATLGNGAPSDGILDLLLTASAPGDQADADGFSPVEALLPLDPGHPFKGVRVRSATNALTLRQIPGHVEALAPTGDCSGCVGKLFVAKGQTAPSGASDTIKEEDLPAGTLVIHPTDGIRPTTPDPNRLTVVLGDDGRIVGAFWN
jgi:hypothetical protein